METIIAQITTELIEEILKNIEEFGISNIGETAESLFSILKKGALNSLPSTTK